ncbi:MAG: erythromycin esterase family protein [Planctomycetes bacterium]|nr:erythromycin esterase family protein [Planctomycetota bacterium]
MSRLMLGLILLTQLAAQHAPAAEPKPDELAWIRDHAIVLKTAKPGRGLEDLKPLKELIGDARIVALGEGTHGTREFFQMKHRLVKFLASEMGFTIFSIEASMPEAYRLNDFVLEGKGDPKELIGGMYFWTWNTQEVLDMVLWMREFNKSGKRKIEFTGFDMQTPDVAAQIVQDFVGKVDPKYAKVVAETYAAVKGTKGGRKFGVATAKFPKKAAAGKRIVYSGYIRTEQVTDGHAGLWWRVDGKSGVVGFDNMYDRGATGTADWKRYEIALDVDPEVVKINFGALLTGEGIAWFDGLQVEIGGRPYTDDTQFDLDFESGSARGFRTGGEGYDVRVVSDQAYTGSQSLRMKCLTGQDDGGVDLKKVAEMCGGVVEHLEDSRRRYRKRASKKDIEWAIQNATVVRQGLLRQTEEVSRDESMAANVSWILRQAPKDAKIVLWAHNGHVSKSNDGHGGRAMGAYLRKKYGDEMVVLGFACNTGRYTAVKRGQGLQANDLQAGEVGSAEYYFHQTGLPRFILDLRKASDKVPASAWLTRSIDFRSIGALAMEEQFSATKLSKAFDAVIYFDKTTPSVLLER